MAYYGYIPYIIKRARDLQRPRILEIGIEHGTSFFPIVHALTKTHRTFEVTGVDVLIREHVELMLQNFELETDQIVSLINDDSERTLNQFMNVGRKFDIVLLDGDHNYATVTKELNLIDKVLEHNGFILADDYFGKWSNVDMWYAERETHKNIKMKIVRSQKQGVKAAIDDFVSTNGWSLRRMFDGEPVILNR